MNNELNFKVDLDKLTQAQCDALSVLLTAFLPPKESLEPTTPRRTSKKTKSVKDPEAQQAEAQQAEEPEAQQAEEPEAQQAEEPEAQERKTDDIEPSALTIADVRALLRKKTADPDFKKLIKEKLEQMNTPNVTSMDVKDYPEFYEFMSRLKPKT